MKADQPMPVVRGGLAGVPPVRALVDPLPMTLARVHELLGPLLGRAPVCSAQDTDARPVRPFFGCSRIC
jgi:hypothetical protein